MRIDEMTMGDMQGMTIDRIRLMGMPHIQCHSITNTNKLAIWHVDEYSVCVLCGRPATNAHHVVPKGAGGGSTVFLRCTEWGRFVLTSPLFAVCGSGNASGCHGRFHGTNKPSVEWIWDDSGVEEMWQTGEIWKSVCNNSPVLNEFGHWEIGGRRVVELRSPWK